MLRLVGAAPTVLGPGHFPADDPLSDGAPAAGGPDAGEAPPERPARPGAPPAPLPAAQWRAPPGRTPLADISPILSAIAECATCKTDRNDLGKVVVEAIHQRLPQAGWTGIYWLEDDELVLGPFVGPPTEHTRIKVGQGVCGTAVAEGRDQVVPDVRERANYLACSTTTRSEIVVLIRAHGKIVGQIDIDSDKVDAFSADDHSFLKMVAGALGSLLDAPPPAPPAK